MRAFRQRCSDAEGNKDLELGETSGLESDGEDLILERHGNRMDEIFQDEYVEHKNEIALVRMLS